MYLVAYAKLLMERDTIEMVNVYYGGMAPDKEAADALARRCANEVRGAITLPRVVVLEDNVSIIDVLYELADNFDKKVSAMRDTNETLKSRRK